MITVVGGVYREQCMRPNWDEFYGSAGRAVSSIAHLGGKASLHSYLCPLAGQILEDRKQAERFDVVGTAVARNVDFRYVHGLARPEFRAPSQPFSPIQVQAEKVLRYGMLEGTAIVDADYAVFDPQNVDSPESFRANGSKAKHLALVLNRYEAWAFLKPSTQLSSSQLAEQLAAKEGAEVVILKMGPQGALVWSNGKIDHIPAYETSAVWKIGSGDQFAATFAYAWMEEGRTPLEAADRASRATAYYCQHLGGFPSNAKLDEFQPNPILVSTQFVDGRRPKVYLAGPFFSLGELWVVEQARQCLTDMGMEVLSPYHDVGLGEAHEVVPKDIQAIYDCDLLLAILDGTDAGTVFEVGFAHHAGKPVIGYAENEPAENLKMMVGTGSFICRDFVTAIYKTVWVGASL